jgi:hypothetical protein
VQLFELGQTPGGRADAFGCWFHWVVFLVESLRVEGGAAAAALPF